MKIKKVEITAFGKFKNYTIDFSDGFNLIFGKNEDGKSTLMAFISLMLYGSAGASARASISGNLRKKYAPWSGEKMSGDMEIECEGRNYLIHKEFRATVKTDKVSVTDLETGDAVNLPPDTEIGKFFLGIDYNAFEKSIFGITADSFAGTESGDIATRLSNLTESGDESVSPKNVIGRIENAMDELVKKRSKGKIALVQDRVDELTDYIEKVSLRAEQKKKLSVEYEKTQNELSELNEQLKRSRLSVEAEENRRKANAYNTYAKLLIDVKNAENAVAEKIGNNDADGILEKCEGFRNSVAVARDVLSKTEKPGCGVVVSDEDMKKYFVLSEEKRVAIENLKKTESAKKKFRIFAILGGVISVLGLVGGFFNSMVFSAIPPGIILLIFGLIKCKNGQSYAELNEIERELSVLFESRNCNSAEEFEKNYRDSIATVEKSRIYDEAQKSLVQAENAFVEYVCQFHAVSSTAEAESFLKVLAELQVNLEKSRQSASSYSSTFEIEEDSPEKLLNLAQDIEGSIREVIETVVDAELIENQIQIKNAKLLEIKGLLGAEPDDIAPAIREKAELEEKLVEMQAYYNHLSMARDVLLEAEDEMRRSFAPALKDRASEILSRLTGGKYSSLIIDKTYEIEVKSEESGGYRSRHYLSRGTCAQSYLALRMALCEMLSEDEKVPLLLDDVLADYDDERQALASKFLENYANEGRQILFFTCHDWQGEFTNKHNILN